MATTAVLQMLVSGKDNLVWFEKNFASLLKQYEQEFIAIENQQVIGHAPKLETLIRLLKKDNIDPSNLLIKFITRVKMIL